MELPARALRGVAGELPARALRVAGEGSAERALLELPARALRLSVALAQRGAGVEVRWLVLLPRLTCQENPA